MKKIIVCLVMAVALAAPPGLVAAQTLPAMPGLPSFGTPGDFSIGNPSVYGGWVSSAGPVSYWGEDAATGQSLKYEYRASALYLGAALPFALGPNWGTFILTVAGTVPATQNGSQQVYDPTLAITDWYTQWRADTYWGTAEGLWVFPALGGPALGASLLGGFRYDCWQTTSKSPIEGVPPIALAPVGNMFLTVNSYVPFFGLMTRAGGLTVGAVGFPYVIGNGLDKQSMNGQSVEMSGVFNRGYFFETFLEYELPAPGSFVGSDFSMSLFAKYSTIEVRSDVTATRTVPPAAPVQQSADFTLRRSLLILGAKGTLNFDLPGLLPY